MTTVRADVVPVLAQSTQTVEIHWRTKTGKVVVQTVKFDKKLELPQPIARPA